MTIEEFIRYIMSLIGGGLVLAVVNWVKEVRSERRKREIDYLQDQLNKLYGPLHCLSAQNQETLKRAEKLQMALNPSMKAESPEQRIPPARGAEADKIIDLSNAYSAKFKENNARIRQLLDANWSLIDVDDVEQFLGFLADCARMQVEVDEMHAEGIAFRVTQQLGDIYYVRPGFVERVTAQWNAKRERLGELLLPRGWPWSRRSGKTR